MELRRRRFGRAVRLEVAAGASEAVREMLTTELESLPTGVPARGADRAERPVGGLRARPTRPPRRDVDADDAAYLATAGNAPTELFAVLRERDVLVHHPYDSFATSVEAFISQAADDPDVLGIKQTLYRTSGDSPIVASLIRAAESGKQVAALVELKARFDELANIGWAKASKRRGARRLRPRGLKTHSKTALVLRREEDGIRRYCHVGTGNYNSKTARLYEDIGLLTSDPDIGRTWVTCSTISPASRDRPTTARSWCRR